MLITWIIVFILDLISRVILLLLFLDIGLGSIGWILALALIFLLKLVIVVNIALNIFGGQLLVIILLSNPWVDKWFLDINLFVVG